MRSIGSLSWGGIFNTHFWIDPHRSMAAVVLMQTLPYYDARAIGSSAASSGSSIADAAPPGVRASHSTTSTHPSQPASRA